MSAAEASVRRIEELLGELAAQDFGYPLGKNEVRSPPEAVKGLPAALVPLYKICNGLSMPDVHVGYFIDSADRVASARERGEPTLTTDAPHTSIHVFGSDGGGGRFAIRLNDGAIYYLPSGGAVRDGVFDDCGQGSERVAETLNEFLCRLSDDVAAFVHEKEGHGYMAR